MFLALSALWLSLFAFGLSLDDQLDGRLDGGLGQLGVLSAPTLLRLGALSLPLVDAWAVLRAGSTLFLHSDVLHLAGNLLAWALIVLTWPRQLSLRWLVGTWCLGGLLSAVGSIVAYSQVGGLSVGPSGALCACLATALPQAGPAWRRGLWLLLGLAFLVGGQLSGGDQGAHVAGLLFGGLFGLGLRARQSARLAPDRSERCLSLAAGESAL